MSEKLTTKLTIHLATDHAGFAHKEAVRDWLEGEGLTVVDHGARELNPLDDFTEFIKLAAKAVASSPLDARGIVFGGSGQGEAMMANRYQGVRAAVYYGGDKTIIKLSREHNDANILSIGARFVDIATTKKIISDWLYAETSSDDKYARRNRSLDEID
jgi:ribose 5-phosphate isomerase B